jgi:hypothetical protein
MRQKDPLEVRLAETRERIARTGPWPCDTRVRVLHTSRTAKDGTAGLTGVIDGGGWSRLRGRLVAYVIRVDQPEAEQPNESRVRWVSARPDDVEPLG